MVIVNAIRGRRVYLDANIFIYAVEGYPDLSEELTELFDSFDGGTLVAITSELTLAEVLVQPLMENNLEVEAAYRKAVQSSAVLEVVPISRDILVEAARLRSQQTKLKLPDAIHGATGRFNWMRDIFNQRSAVEVSCRD